MATMTRPRRRWLWIAAAAAAAAAGSRRGRWTRASCGASSWAWSRRRPPRGTSPPTLRDSGTWPASSCRGQTAFVTYHEEAAAQAALDAPEHVLHGQPLQVKSANPKRPASSSSSKPSSPTGSEHSVSSVSSAPSSARRLGRRDSCGPPGTLKRAHSTTALGSGGSPLPLLRTARSMSQGLPGGSRAPLHPNAAALRAAQLQAAQAAHVAQLTQIANLQLQAQLKAQIDAQAGAYRTGLMAGLNLHPVIVGHGGMPPPMPPFGMLGVPADFRGPMGGHMGRVVAAHPNMVFQRQPMVLPVGIDRQPSCSVPQIFVSNLHHSVACQELRDIFSSFGNVVYTELLRDSKGHSRLAADKELMSAQGKAVVRFSSTWEAAQAIALAHNQLHKGRHLVVREDLSGVS
eukprot:SM000135S26999  [mRNA]  locus=s135:171926:174662:- [translate_table: standard]